MKQRHYCNVDVLGSGGLGEGAAGKAVRCFQRVEMVVSSRVRTSASDIWELEIQPVYRNTAPYAQKIYSQGQDFAINTALPHAQYAGNTAWAFWARQIWPNLEVSAGYLLICVRAFLLRRGELHRVCMQGTRRLTLSQLRRCRTGALLEAYMKAVLRNRICFMISPSHAREEQMNDVRRAACDIVRDKTTLLYPRG